MVLSAVAWPDDRLARMAKASGREGREGGGSGRTPDDRIPAPSHKPYLSNSSLAFVQDSRLRSSTLWPTRRDVAWAPAWHVARLLELGVRLSAQRQSQKSKNEVWRGRDVSGRIRSGAGVDDAARNH